LQASELRGVLRGLPLSVVEVRGHGDDRAEEVVVEGVSARWRSVARISAETSTGDFTPSTVCSCSHARCVDEVVRQLLAVREVDQARVP
jgi:hypothetical protein